MRRLLTDLSLTVRERTTSMLALLGALLLLAVPASGIGICLSPDGGTDDQDEQVSITASEAPQYVSPNQEPCCGGDDAVYEFYDIEYTSWSGDVLNTSGNGADLDTSAPGDKSVTCDGEMTFRCSGDGEITEPKAFSGTAILKWSHTRTMQCVRTKFAEREAPRTTRLPGNGNMPK